MFKRKTRSILLSVLLGVFLFGAVLPVFSPLLQKKVSAEDFASASELGLSVDANNNVQAGAGDFVLTWVDAAHLTLGFKDKPELTYTFTPMNEADNGTGSIVDQRNDGDDVDYHVAGWPCKDGARVHIGERDPDNPITSMQLIINVRPTSASSCQELKINDVPTAKPELSVAYFTWSDSGTIVGVDDFSRNDNKAIGRTFVQRGEDDKEIFIQSSQVGEDCPNFIYAYPDNTMKFFFIDKDFDKDLPDDPPGIKGKFPDCKYEGSLTIDGDKAPPTSNKTMTIAGIENAGKAPGTGTGASGLDGASSADEDSCESSGFTLSFIFCGVIDGLSSFTEVVFKNVIEPYLRTSPISTDAGSASNPNPIYQVWAVMRNIADVLLVFGLLAIVFGQAIGGGLVDAYTAKKALPRILVAAILINLSLFIVAALVDIFNVIGAGIGDLIIGPFKKTILGKFKTSDGTTGVGAIIVLIVLFLIGLIRAGAFSREGGPSAGGGFIHFFLLFVLLPAALITIAIFATLVIRRGLIVILVVLAPIAFALFTLPATEKYFKKWWSTLVQTLMVYPIMTIIFSVASVLAAISYNVNDTDGGAFSGFIAAMVALIIVLIPLVLIPFAFKLAGGVIGSLYETATGHGKRISEGVKGNANDPNSLRNRVRKRAGDTAFQYRERMIQSGIKREKAPGGNRLTRRRGVISSLAAMGNYELERSNRNAEAAEVIRKHVGTGADNLVRAAFAKEMKYTDKEGRERTGWFGTSVFDDGSGYAVDAAGSRVSDPTFSESEVKAARKLQGNSPSTYQDSLRYEMTKVGDDREYGELLERNRQNLSGDGYASHMQNQAGFIQIGAGYANQSARKEGKHYKLAEHHGPPTTKVNPYNGESYEVSEGGLYYKIDNPNFTRDFAENVGTYPASQMKTSTIKALGAAHTEAVTELGGFAAIRGNAAAGETDRQARDRQITATVADEATRSKLLLQSRSLEDTQLIANTLDTRMRMGGQIGQAADDGPPITGGGTGAAGRVNQEITDFVTKVKGPGTTPGAPTTPPPAGPLPPTPPVTPYTPPVP